MQHKLDMYIFLSKRTVFMGLQVAELMREKENPQEDPDADADADEEVYEHSSSCVNTKHPVLNLF